MAPRDIYEDDDKLSKLLDNLIDSTNEEVYETPHAADVLLTNLDSTFTSSNISEGILATRVLLNEGGIKVSIPDLDPDRNNAREVLAATLTATVRLARCCKANVNLRNEAENRVQLCNQQFQQTCQTLSTTKEKLKRKESQIAAMENTKQDIMAKHRREIRKLTAEINDLKTRLTNASHRENHLVLEAKKKVKDYALLQQRVHSLMGSAKKVNILPTITSASERSVVRAVRRPRPLPGAKNNTKRQYLAMSQEAVEARVTQLESENVVFRNLLQAIQAEFDELLVHVGISHSSDTSHYQDVCDEVDDKFSKEVGVEIDSEHTKKSCEEDVGNHTEDPTSEVSSDLAEESAEDKTENSDGDSVDVTEEDTNGHVYDNADYVNEDTHVPSTPSSELMNLPFSVIRSGFEESLEQKFTMVREALLKLR